MKITVTVTVEEPYTRPAYGNTPPEQKMRQRVVFQQMVDRNDDPEVGGLRHLVSQISRTINERSQ